MLVVDDVGILDSEIVDHESKRDGAGDMAEEHGGVGLMVAMRLEVGEEAELGKEAGLGETGDAFFDVSKQEGVTSPIRLDKRGEAELRQEGGGIVAEGDPNGGGGSKNVGAVIEVTDVECAEDGIFGHYGV